jgi:L-cystine uptake protein TcyP (sodium:dicarboxylate symporter family)
MFRIIFGIVIGFMLAMAVNNPNDAKKLAVKSVDAVHNGYVASAKAMDEPTVLPAPSAVVAPVTDAVKKAVKE